MNDLLNAIESGKQRGFSKSISIDGMKYCIGSAIQKYQGKYKAHVYKIKESNMDSEIFDVCFTRAFLTLDEAIKCIGDNGDIQFNELTILKGQKLFNPKFDEENET